jgi:hypothetical protein
VSLAGTQAYLKNLLNGLTWPAGMQALSSPPNPLACYITPPNPYVESASTPTAYVWTQKGTENRDNAKYGAGTIPRAAFLGAPSGTKAVMHAIPVYVVWDNTLTDPLADSLFPGMLDAIMSVLRVSTDEARITDPWTGVESALVDVGETIEWDVDLWTVATQRLGRYDALLTLPIVEVIAG